MQVLLAWLSLVLIPLPQSGSAVVKDALEYPPFWCSKPTHHLYSDTVQKAPPLAPGRFRTYWSSRTERPEQ